MRPTDIDLMRFADGEVSDAEANDLGRAVDAHSDARRIVEGIDQLGEFVRGVALARAGEVDLTDAIMERVNRDPRLRMVANGPAEAQAAGRGLRAAGLAAALAAAAAAVVVAWPEGAPAPRPAPTTAVRFVYERPAPKFGEALEPARVAQSADAEDMEPEVTIETVEFGSAQGTLFMVSADVEETTPVVWISD